ncbi:hypothetical protein WER83_07320 [Staphylococcus felis]|uniref:SA0570 family protein n=1 Tax=Staphylococcus felis TaxID=46127 RepID=UPI003967AE34
MRKLVSAILIITMMFFGISASSVHAAEGNTLKSVQELQNGSKSIQNVKIGDSLYHVEKQYGKGIHTQSAYSHEHYYEYHLHEGLLVITTESNHRNAKVKRIAMSYNDIKGATYKDVKSLVGHQATTREHYNNITGNHGYIQDDKVSYQFTTQNPADKVLKLYRVDIEA